MAEANQNSDTTSNEEVETSTEEQTMDEVPAESLLAYSSVDTGFSDDNLLFLSLEEFEASGYSISHQSSHHDERFLERETELQGAVGGVQEPEVLGSENNTASTAEARVITIHGQPSEVNAGLDPPNGDITLHPRLRQRQAGLELRDHVVLIDYVPTVPRLIAEARLDAIVYEEAVPEQIVAGSNIDPFYLASLIQRYPWIRPRNRLCMLCHRRNANIFNFNCHEITLCHECIDGTLVCPRCNEPILAYIRLPA